MKRIIKFRAYTEISNEVLGMKYDVPHNYNDTVMQFTGLLDRNGKEIYEGDVVKEPDTPNREITFKDGSFMMTMDDGQRYLPAIGRREILGNIYEHGHLLNGGESSKISG